ncbi:MAG TPA: M50 family metallopeptidase, partial [Candidatus Poseidoniia archaeon]|nr:M50 family metallopeptidase [Candidatus Poseidoniia archaeon]
MWRDPSRGNQTFQVRHVMSDGWGEPVQVNRRPHSKMAFSDYEKEQLRESIGFLTLAFALALSNGLFVVMDDPSILITTLPLAFAAVMTGFLLHELAHKWMAQQYGCWAEYRGNKNGLYFALAMSAFGFLLAAPGAVMVSGRITDRQNGIIAAVGPLTNIAIAIVALPIYIFTAGLDWYP